MHAIREKRRIINEDPEAVELYDIIGPIFFVESLEVNDQQYFRFEVKNVRVTQSTIDRLNAIFNADGPYLGFESVTGNALKFYIFNNPDLLNDLVVWDGFMHSSNLLMQPIVYTKYNSINSSIM